MTEEEAKARLRLLELEGMQASQPAEGASAPKDGASPEKDWAPPLVRGATGFATGVGEGVNQMFNPATYPHTLETFARAPFQDVNPENPWYQRLGERFQKASDSSVTPRMSIEQMAPYLRAGARQFIIPKQSYDEPSTSFGEKLDQEQKAQKEFTESMPAGARLAGELTPGLAGIAQAVAKLAGVGNAAKSYANEARVSALGGGKASVKKLLQDDKIQALGNQMHEDNIMGPFTSRPKIQENIEAAQSGYGKQIGDVVKAADATTNGQGLVPAADIIKQAREEVLTPLLQRSTTRAAAEKIAAEIDAFEAKHGQQMLTLEELQTFKKDISDLQKPFERAGDNPAIQGYKKLYGSFNKAGENALEDVEKSLPEGMNLQDFKAAKTGYGNNTTALKMIADRNAREATNRMFSPTDHIVGGAAAVSGDEDGLMSIVKGLGAATVNKVLRGYGNQMKASAWQSLANGINGGSKDPWRALLNHPATMSVGTAGTLSQQPSWKKMLENGERR